MKKRFITGIFLVIIILLAGIFFWKFFKHPAQKTTISSEKKVKPLPQEVTVTLNKSGFTPNTVTIKVDSAIRWINKSGTQQTVNSDKYPTNQLHRELNFGVFNSDSSVVYTFTKPGTYGYHNQFHHEQVGKVIVVR